jgi:hypothetical protein
MTDQIASTHCHLSFFGLATGEPVLANVGP